MNGDRFLTTDIQKNLGLWWSWEIELKKCNYIWMQVCGRKMWPSWTQKYSILNHLIKINYIYLFIFSIKLISLWNLILYSGKLWLRISLLLAKRIMRLWSSKSCLIILCRWIEGWNFCLLSFFIDLYTFFSKWSKQRETRGPHTICGIKICLYVYH